jgi:hypothetical protein
MRRLLFGAAMAAGVCILGSTEAQASSHREAPFVTKNPKVDSTDFYMFNSYESGRPGYVTLIANYLPLQDSYGGPNYFELDPEALYEIHVDNNGDGAEDVTFQFKFKHALNGANGLGVDVTLQGAAGPETKNVNVPLMNIGGISVGNPTANLHVLETYDVTMVKGDRRAGTSTVLKADVKKPVDFIGTTTFGSAAAYETYAKSHVTAFDIAGCATPAAKVFVGQRREGFAANIGIIFDLIQAPNGAAVVTGGGSPQGRGFNVGNPFDTGLLYNKNVTTIALEVHKDCLKAAGGSEIIGGWTSASMRQARVLNPNESYAVPTKEGGAWTQVSKLGMPLVNEVVIGLKDKDAYNSASPKDTAKFAEYVTHPTLAKLIEILYGAGNPGAQMPVKVRTDLVGVFATGLTVKKTDDTDFNLNQTSTGPGNPGPAGNALPAGIYEMLRLNTAVPATTKDAQTLKGGPATSGSNVRGLGALGCFTAERKLDTALATCDPAGFPNGRRPGDDVVDIALRVVMGALFPTDADAPARNTPFTDANFQGPDQFDESFPYLRTPLPGNVPLAPQQP